MKSKRWAIAVFSIIALAPVVSIGWFTVTWLTSSEFGKDVECWLKPGDGHWMTPNEAHYLGMMFYGSVSLLAAIIAFIPLAHWQLINKRTAGIILGLAVLLGVVIIAVNANTNDGYVDRLYKACGQVS